MKRPAVLLLALFGLAFAWGCSSPDARPSDGGGPTGGASSGTAGSGGAGTGTAGTGTTGTGTAGSAGTGGGANSGAAGDGGNVGGAGTGSTGTAGIGGLGGGAAGRGGSSTAGTGGVTTTGTGGGASGAAGSQTAGTGGAAGSVGACGTGAAGLPARADVLSAARLANKHFSDEWPNPAVAIDSSHASNIWTRGVYYEGLMALNAVDPQTAYVDYAVTWAAGHNWGLNGGTTTRSADNQCAGQTYIDLYNLSPAAVRIHDIQADIDMMVAGSVVNDWTWIDAIQMSMPVFAKLGVLLKSTKYFDRMYAMYASTKTKQGGNGLYSKTDHLWWRDQNFDPPFTTPGGKSCYWSRGNGWVYAALVRVLDILPASDPHRAEYLADFIAMSAALRAVQRSDGYWNVSLFDPTDFGGEELTGTALFTYGMAWGVRNCILSDTVYLPVAVKAWGAMVTNSLHTNGFLGWVQGSGDEPSSSQPVTFDKVPDYEDFGVGCFLLAGSEMAKLATP